MEEKKNNRFLPLIIAVSIVFGIAVGFFYAAKGNNTDASRISYSSNKINALLNIIERQYVDTVDMNEIIEQTMPLILKDLDPHSAYIPAKEQQEANEQIEGSFSGIGVQFMINKDTVNVVRIIPGGPSERVGMIAGDRIIAVDDSAFVGKIVTNDNTMKRLKGPKGSTVKLTVYRPALKKNMDFTVTRGDIPIKSIDACYMIDNETGYIKINSFSLTTYEEMLGCIAELKHKNCKGLVIDLRSNPGGVMEIAVRMVNEFLPAGKLIVYTEGRNSPKKEYFSDGYGSCQDMPLTVLINESSASASEIFSGAIQDNDRGVVIGRRSFGKGLVQQPVDFNDGSGVRITIARYFIPSGRCIQREYEKGHKEEYELDILDRYNHGEFFSKDSIKIDSTLVYKTSKGRTVYGGGGVIPDIFIAQDTVGYTSYLGQVNASGLINRFSLELTDRNRETFDKFETPEELIKYLDRNNIVEDFVRYADKEGIKRRNLLIRKSYNALKRNIYASIIYDVFDMQELIRYLNQDDKEVIKAVKIIKENGADPMMLQ